MSATAPHPWEVDFSTTGVVQNVPGDCKQRGTSTSGGLRQTSPAIAATPTTILAATKQYSRVRVENDNSTATVLTITGGHVRGSPGLTTISLAGQQGGRLGPAVGYNSGTPGSPIFPPVPIQDSRTARSCVEIERRRGEDLVISATNSGGSNTVTMHLFTERPDLVARGI
jgi:hypothetical protein